MTALATLALSLLSAVALAQAPPPAAGRWEGAIEIPAQELKVVVDLAFTNQAWQGTIAIPAQGLKDFPLADIVILGEAVGFAMDGIPGRPRFKGTLDTQKRTISGEFMQGEGTVGFSLTRTGDAQIAPVPAGTAITPALAGEWAGALDANGRTLRLVLKLTANGDRPASGVLVSVDQGNAEIPLTAVTQAGTHVTILVRRVGGTFEGDLKDGQLVGTWTQGPGSLPLVFSRPK